MVSAAWEATMSTFVLTTVITLAVVVLFARREGSADVLAFICCVLGFSALMINLLYAFFFLGVGLALGIAVVPEWAPKRRVYWIAALLPTLAVYVYAFSMVRNHEREMERLRQLLPDESLEDRLAYEDKRGKTKPVFSEEGLRRVENHIEARSAEGVTRRHHDALHALHQETFDDFVAAPGFGVGRGVRSARGSIQVPLDEAIPLPKPTAHPLSADDLVRAATDLPLPERRALELAASSEQLADLHFSGLSDFLNPIWFGLVKDRSKVIGFVPHAFSKMPAAEKTISWQVESVELVSLLKHKDTVVYVSENLPRMKELKGAATRLPTPFEKAGLERLQRGDDLHVDYAPEMIRMLGSIRAGKQCLECHHAERGELLGAFAYRLRREAK
jgi:hypothetical protein